METVHCDRQCLMRLLRNRSIRHCTGLKSLYDLIHTLNLINVDTLLRIFEIKKTS